ncbi:alpha/beta hydrolase [Actinorhabdospora filicis]|nr:alpha/beta hydrolase [Actinorhabdospora filicis]
MDPELAAFIPLFPPADLTDVPAARELHAKLTASAPVPDLSGMDVEDHVVSGEADVPVRVYRPREARGAILWFHGGGFVMGGLDSEHPWAARVAEASGAVVVSVDYRLAPENPYPAAIDDAYAVLTWAAENAGRLGFDAGRLAVAGHSAGATIAAALCLRTRDEGGPRVHFQLLNQPGLDDRLETWSARHFTDTPWLTRGKLASAWGHYLAGRAADEYAAPARAEDLSGLPAAYIASAEFCPNRDEDILYALRLLQAGVPVELHQWPGTFHGSQAITSAEVSRRQLAELGAVLRRALA